MNKLQTIDRDLILFHIGFAILTLITLLAPFNLPVGMRVLGLVLAYNLFLPVIAKLRNHHEWFGLWLFLVPLSALQVFPDWFLAEALGIIEFPDTGAPRIGAIPIFMAGMWTIPLFLIVWTGNRIKTRTGNRSANLAVAALTAALFMGAEATLWRVPIWQAVNVTTISHVAIYLILPEIILGLTTFWAYNESRERPLHVRLGAAFLLMLIYLGGLSLFYLIVEKVLL